MPVLQLDLFDAGPRVKAKKRPPREPLGIAKFDGKCAVFMGGETPGRLSAWFIRESDAEKSLQRRPAK